MNITLLPTDLKLTDKGTDKSQPTLNNNSSQFGQLLNAETASMRRPITQADKNSLTEEKSTSDQTAESGWPQLAAVSDNSTVKDKSSVEAAPQENRAEFAVLKDEDLLSAEALSAAIPIQLAGLLTSHTHSAVLAENSPGLMGKGALENTLLENPSPEDALSETLWLDSENSPANTLLVSNAKDSRLTDTNFVERSKAGEQGENIQLSAQQTAIPLNNKTADPVSLQTELAPLTGQLKLTTNHLATNDKVESDKTLLKETVSGNSKDPNLLQMAIPAASALPSSTAETASIDSPVLASPSLLSAGQQFQLNSSATTTPLLNAHLGNEEWQQQLNQHVLFFHRNGLQQAELRLHPQELGALHIRMSVEDNQAQLHFVSAHQNVRAALEAALPGLRHALAENGIQLAQSSVNSDAHGNGQQAYFANNPNSNSDPHAETQESGLTATTEITASSVPAIKVTPQQLTLARGGIDIFA
ncbi:flagellar hook-length control protein FliK [Xenorhabdus griffiniae]|uniref:Flagellar hook-length control protein FliK n=1 Tax=Xenorhabdus griffiniae TaxID=351672 RepID=A0ABY9XME2_9GAMM|nr:flagellar hook-length control protein FliK [Xenorhabdus griffiniae]MBD1227271.1 flagellar hook-length control protein FliK [Xenorhabdus griffiniae]MBE8586686.1 flagellar hook-length control protein FliK [Xenorhabdus griffiniae]WMV73981.1 flagellar hook-length control protein FliK [Xenorhabdus griffiniae]WNH03661.1 flagellar hook-length control protein FliK [Xenorhabdus griffiniae]